MTNTYTGACHCGAVCFEVDLDLSQGVTRCNCSICHKLGRNGVVVKPAAFRLVSGEADLREYLWGSRSGAHCFCAHCGVHAFGRGHLELLGGDYVSINVNVLDGVDPLDLVITHLDGRHDTWAASSTPWPIGARVRVEEAVASAHQMSPSAG